MSSPPPPAPQTLPAGLARAMLLDMWRIRLAEEQIGEMVTAGEVRCPAHLYIGQEAVAVGVCRALREDDFIFGNHRSHGHYLAKGGSLPAMMAEVLGRATGCSKGRGGSMHLVAPEVGLPGTSAMVATGVPLAVGAAIGFAMQASSRVAVAFFGDGAGEEGAFHESLNLAALRRAPVLFVCENNLYASHLPLLARRPSDNLLEIARANNISALRLDGNDVLAVYGASVEMVARAREGQGPAFLECRTYRWRGHVGPNLDLEKGLRSPEELEAWMARDPIRLLEESLIEAGLLAGDEAGGIRLQAQAEVAAAVAFARDSPFPEAAELADFVFASPDPSHG